MVKHFELIIFSEKTASHDLSEAQYLHTTFGRAGASRPIVARSLLAGLPDIAVVKSYRTQQLSLNGKSDIENAPVKLSLEVLSEPALSRIAMPGEQEEIELSVCRQNQFH